MATKGDPGYPAGDSNEPVVSVIIPTYNRERELFRALKSVFDQVYRPIEVIVIDDCSTDHTVELLEKSSFLFPIQLIVLPSNQGPAAARNAGLKIAMGKYVAFLDSDDYWLRNKLTEQVRIIEESCKPEITVVCSQSYFRRKYDIVICPNREKLRAERLCDYMFAGGQSITTCCVMLPTTFAQKVAFTPDLRLHEDWDFLLRLEAAGAKFLVCLRPLSVVEDANSTGRASTPRPDLSITWLEAWRDRMSPAAYLGLRARIAPQLRNQSPFVAVRFIFDAWTQRAIGFWPLLVLVGRLVHPNVREAAYWLHGLLQRNWRFCGGAGKGIPKC